LNNSPAVNGAEIIHHNEEELIELSRKTTLFTRMFPEAKLKMVNAFKKDGEVVAILGDGVNDAPALKADISEWLWEIKEQKLPKLQLLW
jgi:Ca2+-transporting ATPase